MDGPRFPSQIANRLGNIHHNAQHPACQTFSVQQGRNAWDLPMADNGTVLLTYKHIGTQAVRFYFSLTGVKRLMEGLNKLCFMSMYLRP